MKKQCQKKTRVSLPFSLSHPLDGGDRWKWTAGATIAAGTVATSAATAATVQITQTNSFVTRAANQLKADMTGDSVNDLQLRTLSDTLGSVGLSRRFYLSAFNGLTRLARVRAATFSNTETRYSATVGTVIKYGAIPQTTREFVPVTFTDSKINGGAVTNGLLEVLAFNTSFFVHEIRLVRLVFDDATTAAPSNAVPGGINPTFDPSIYALRSAQAAFAAQAARAARVARFIYLKKKIAKITAAQRKAKAQGNVRLVLKYSRQIGKFRREQRALL